MEPLDNLGDERQLAWCVYCGGDTGTGDHVPPRVLLDKPYPTYLHQVRACRECNVGLSLDEEYVACLVDCARTGSVSVDGPHRERIKDIFRRKPALLARLAQAQRHVNGQVVIEAEVDRVRNVVLKLGRGHAAYELNEPKREAPESVSFFPLTSMSLEDRLRFESPPYVTFWPEVGSRSMQRLVVADSSVYSVWVDVQPGRYRFMTAVDELTIIRVVLSEYLACEVVWQ